MAAILVHSVVYYVWMHYSFVDNTCFSGLPPLIAFMGPPALLLPEQIFPNHSRNPWKHDLQDSRILTLSQLWNVYHFSSFWAQLSLVISLRKPSASLLASTLWCCHLFMLPQGHSKWTLIIKTPLQEWGE